MLTFILGNTLCSCQVPTDLETQMFHRGSWIFDELSGFKIFSFLPLSPALSGHVSIHVHVIFYYFLLGNSVVFWDPSVPSQVVFSI